MNNTVLDNQDSSEELNKFRLKRSRRLHIIMTILAVVYGLLIVQFTPSFKNERYFLEFLAITAGTVNFLIYQFLPDSFFKPISNLILNLLNLIFTAYIVQITGGLSSPFTFFYPIIILSAIVTMNLKLTLVFIGASAECLMIHYLTSSTSVIIPAGSLNDLFFSVARILILGTYAIILVSDIFSQEQKNLIVGTELKRRLIENELTCHLDQEIASRRPLDELLENALEKTSSAFKASIGLIILHDELNNRWRTAATHKLVSHTTHDINPEKIKEELVTKIEKQKKSEIVSSARIKEGFPALKPLELTSLIISPLSVGERLVGMIALGHHHTHFSGDDSDFLDNLSTKFALTISNALALEAQDQLFRENEKIAQDSFAKMERMAKLLEIKGVET